MSLDEEGKFNNVATAAAWALSNEIVVGYVSLFVIAKFVNIVVMHYVVDTVIVFLLILPMSSWTNAMAAATML